eukprot:8537694-Prorocentrum_lima.AAC.1
MKVAAASHVYVRLVELHGQALLTMPPLPDVGYMKVQHYTRYLDQLLNIFLHQHQVLKRGLGVQKVSHRHHPGMARWVEGTI